jgi:hypothetical protein
LKTKGLYENIKTWQGLICNYKNLNKGKILNIIQNWD